MARLLFVHALTSIHPGTGQGVGTIDLPIARERATYLPIIPGATLKGCLRAGGLVQDEAQREDVFGKPDFQGKLRVSDARLLLLPVRCPANTFMWVTSPYLLRRLKRDCSLVDLNGLPLEIPNPSELQADTVDKTAAVTVAGQSRLVLEDLDFELRSGTASDWAAWLAEQLFPDEQEWRNEFLQRLVVIADKNFDYLSEFATEVQAHVTIGDSGTVVRGALWYEETLPAETILVAIVDETKGVQADKVVPKTLRIGGNETTGQGLARLRLSGGAS